MENMSNAAENADNADQTVPDEFQDAVNKAKEAGSSLTDRLDTLGKTGFDEPKAE